MPSVLRGAQLVTPESTTMPVMDTKAETRISSVALDVLRCYASSFDKLVYTMAEDLARDRQKKHVDAGRPVRIELEDVRKAAELLTDAVEQRFGKDKDYSHVVEDVKGMHECLKNRCESILKEQAK